MASGPAESVEIALRHGYDAGRRGPGAGRLHGAASLGRRLAPPPGGPGGPATHCSCFLHVLCRWFLIAVVIGHTSVAASAAHEVSDAAVPARHYAAIPARRYVDVARGRHHSWLHRS